jgi:hypothetical protein
MDRLRPALQAAITSIDGSLSAVMDCILGFTSGIAFQ